MFALLARFHRFKESTRQTSRLFREIPDFDIEDDNPDQMHIGDTCAYTKDGWPMSSKMGFSQWYDDCQRPYMPE